MIPSRRPAGRPRPAFRPVKPWGWAMAGAIPAVILGLAAAFLAGCGHHEEHSTLMERIRAAESQPDSAARNPGEELSNLYARLETVAWWDSARGDTVRFPDRRLSLRHFPCSGCHSVPGAQGAPGPASGDRRAHFGLVLDHAPAGMMTCATCHGQGMGKDALTTLAGAPVGFEVSFQVCAQCHFQQARDVLGGAHGKRLHGWQGPRVIQNCAGCHDPHSPAMPRRWPAATETRKEAP